MAKDGIPGDLRTEPDLAVVFNAPFDVANTHNFRFTNLGETKISWFIKIQNFKKFSVEPGAGVLDAKQKCWMTLTVNPWDIEGDASSGADSYSIEWVTVLPNVTKPDHDQLKQAKATKRKVIKINYNI